MTICKHFNEDMAESKKMPVAVPVAWFLLGILLIVSDFMLLTTAGYLLAAFAAYKLFFRGRILACCISHYREALAKGEKPSMECMKDLLV
ncbi:MAG: hypothetical protein U9Q75_07025 [Pseudomonadota bacterium]|nr:hypothetical protein [Pseudomonadota bacterium]